MTLAAIDEDPITNPGTLVRDIVASAGGDRITDVDWGALGGHRRHRRGQHATARGSTRSTTAARGWRSARPPPPPPGCWAPTPAPASASCPHADWHGTVDPGLTFRAWDHTQGFNGQTADASTGGGATAFSAATATASITVNPLNGTPDLRNSSVTGNGFTTLQVTYEIADDPASPFDLGFYRSDDAAYQAGDALLDTRADRCGGRLDRGRAHQDVRHRRRGRTGRLAGRGARRDRRGRVRAGGARPGKTRWRRTMQTRTTRTTRRCSAACITRRAATCSCTGPKAMTRFRWRRAKCELTYNGTLYVYTSADVSGLRIRAHGGNDTVTGGTVAEALWIAWRRRERRR